MVDPRELISDIADIRKAIKSPVASTGANTLRNTRHSGCHTFHTMARRPDGAALLAISGGGYVRNITEPRTRMQVVEFIHMDPSGRTGRASRAVDTVQRRIVSDPGTPPLIPNPIPPEWDRLKNQVITPLGVSLRSTPATPPVPHASTVSAHVSRGPDALAGVPSC